MASKYLIGLEAIKKMIKEERADKVFSAVEGNKVTIETLKFILENEELSSSTVAYICTLLNRSEYKFLDIYNSFEEYVNSNLAKTLCDEGESCNIYPWIATLPSNSDELISLFKSSKEEVKQVIFKTLVYRNRVMTLPIELISDYANCTEGLIYITKRSLNLSEREVFTYLIKWGFYIGEDFIKSAEGILDKNELGSALASRIESKYICTSLTKGNIMEATIVIPYVHQIKRDWTICSRALSFWGAPRFIKHLTDESGIKLLKHYYLEAAAQILLDKKTSVAEYNALKDLVPIALCLEESDDNRNFIFKKAVVSMDYKTVFRGLSEAVDSGFTFEVTEEMESISKLMASSDFETLIIKDKITTAEELIRLKDDSVFYSEKIQSMSCNPILAEKINLGDFPKKELEKVSQYLDWSNIQTYFYSENPPEKLIVENLKKVGVSSLTMTLGLGYFSADGLIKVAKEINNRGGKASNTLLARALATIMDDKSITPEQIAEFIKSNNLSLSATLLSRGENKCNSNVTIKSILSFL